MDNIISKISIDDVVYEINSGVDTSDATATENDILLGKTAYARGFKIEGTIPILEESSYTPTSEDQTIEPGKYLNGVQTIKGDPNLVAENIKKGTEIFNILGTFTDDISGNGNLIAYATGVMWASGNVLNKVCSAGNYRIFYSAYAWEAGETTTASLKIDNVQKHSISCGAVNGKWDTFNFTLDKESTVTVSIGGYKAGCCAFLTKLG